MSERLKWGYLQRVFGQDRDHCERVGANVRRKWKGNTMYKGRTEVNVSACSFAFAVLLLNFAGCRASVCLLCCVA